MITTDLLRAATGCTPDRAELFAGPLAEACAQYGIDTPQRLAAFLAQIGHESGSLLYVRELADGSAYEGRADLGNTRVGDGKRFRGRGLIQLTGRHNYRTMTEHLQRFGAPDFLQHPEALEEPRWAAMSAGDYWDTHGLNALADRGDFDGITRRINGGLNGIEDRRRRLAVATQALSAPPTPTPEPPKMVAPLLIGLASSLIDIFEPLAREKIQKEIGRHTDKPEAAEQVTTAVIEAAKLATGKADPIEAVAAARANPAAVQTVQDAALDHLEKMAPVFERLAGLEAAQWAAEESSREAAARRAAATQNDMGPMLATWAVRGMFGIIGALVLILVVQIALDPAHKPMESLVTALVGMVFAVAGKYGTVYDYRFGSSRQSAAKDAVIDELSRTRGTPPR